jgi:hypothetical protein
MKYGNINLTNAIILIAYYFSGSKINGFFNVVTRNLLRKTT